MPLKSHIKEDKMADRALKLHEEWMKNPEEHWKVIQEHQKLQGGVASVIAQYMGQYKW